MKFLSLCLSIESWSLDCCEWEDSDLQDDCIPVVGWWILIFNESTYVECCWENSIYSSRAACIMRAGDGGMCQVCHQMISDIMSLLSRSRRSWWGLNQDNDDGIMQGSTAAGMSLILVCWWYSSSFIVMGSNQLIALRPQKLSLQCIKTPPIKMAGCNKQLLLALTMLDHSLWSRSELKLIGTCVA